MVVTSHDFSSLSPSWLKTNYHTNPQYAKRYNILKMLWNWADINLSPVSTLYLTYENFSSKIVFSNVATSIDVCSNGHVFIFRNRTEQAFPLKHRRTILWSLLDRGNFLYFLRKMLLNLHFLIAIIQPRRLNLLLHFFNSRHCFLLVNTVFRGRSVQVQSSVNRRTRTRRCRRNWGRSSCFPVNTRLPVFDQRGGRRSQWQMRARKATKRSP